MLFPGFFGAWQSRRQSVGGYSSMWPAFTGIDWGRRGLGAYRERAHITSYYTSDTGSFSVHKDRFHD